MQAVATTGRCRRRPRCICSFRQRLPTTTSSTSASPTHGSPSADNYLSAHGFTLISWQSKPSPHFVAFYSMIQHRMPSLPSSLSRAHPFILCPIANASFDVSAMIVCHRQPACSTVKSLLGKTYNFELLAIPHEIAHYVYQHGSWQVTH